MSGTTSDKTETAKKNGGFVRWLPLIVLAAGLILVFSMGWHTALIRTIGLNVDAIKAFVSQNLLVSLLAFLAAYAAAVVLIPPVGSVLTIGGGLVFGALYSVPATVIGATIGATILFLIVKTSIGQALADRAGAWVDKLRDGFSENALSYMLFLRLVPAFPFFVVNVVPGLIGVPLRTYIIGTFIGIIPGTTAYALLGEGAGSIFAKANAEYQACVAASGSNSCVYNLSFADLVTPELIMAFAALAVVALIPVVINWYKKRKSNHAAA